MKKVFNLLLCIYVTATFANCNLHSKKSAHVVQQSQAEELQTPQKEDFNKFIERFHSDSLFQISRVADAVSGHSWEYEEEKRQNWTLPPEEMPADEPFIWNKDKLIHVLRHGVDIAYGMDEYENCYKIQGDTVVYERIVIDVATSCYYQSEFKQKNGMWILVSLMSVWDFV